MSEFKVEMRFYQLWFATSCITIFQAQAEIADVDPFANGADAPKQIRVIVEFVEVSQEQLSELMFGKDAPSNDTVLRKRVGELLKNDKASVAETLMSVTTEGKKASSESTTEYIYPTEYEPAELPLEKVAEANEDPKAEKEHSAEFALGPTPTAFETRNLGGMLEIEPKLPAGSSIIELRMLAELVYHVGNEVWAEWKGHYGNSPIQMPKFYKIGVNTTVYLVPEKPMMVAAVSPKDKEGNPDPARKLMVFVRADLVN